MNGRYSPSSTPVDEMGGQELYVLEWDVARRRDLGERLGRRRAANVMSERASHVAGEGLDIFEDFCFVVQEKEGEVSR